MRGTGAPSGSATVGDFISGTHMLGLGHIVYLLQHIGQAQRQRGNSLRLDTVVQVLCEPVTQRGQRGQPVTGLSNTN
jgi:hypothetical protein